MSNKEYCFGGGGVEVRRKREMTDCLTICMHMKGNLSSVNSSCQHDPVQKGSVSIKTAHAYNPIGTSSDNH